LPPTKYDALAIEKLNFYAVLHTIETFVPHMAENGGGRIILINSLTAWRGSRCAPYAQSNANVLNEMRERCPRYAALGLTINALLPGPVESPFFRKSCDFTRQTQYLHEIPMHRYADPAEIAAAALFLASPEASYITGAMIPISGGLL
jgi:NAD(P)-dependent dehydrogenase (short-subunit alcohol dehydrogenase family)